jgi:hypothetical protein
MTPINLRLLAYMSAAAIMAAAVGALAPGTAIATTTAPHWTILTTSVPTYFKAGDEGDSFEVLAVNDGGAATDGSTIKVTDSLPLGVTPTSSRGESYLSFHQVHVPMSCSGTTCELTAAVSPAEVVQMRILVTVHGNATGTLANTATISGGGARSATATSATPVTAAAVPFGASLVTSTGDDTQAGSHPAGVTSILSFHTSSVMRAATRCLPDIFAPVTTGCALSDASAKDVSVALPAGLIGNSLGVPRCSQSTFQSEGGFNCPADTQVGRIQLYFYGPGGTQGAPVYNVVPPPGEPAELGFTAINQFHIPMFFHVRSDGDYGLTAQLSGVSQGVNVESAVMSLWGVPADPSHDEAREGKAPCEFGCASDVAPRPFLTLPTSCSGGEVPVGLAGDSWQDPAASLEALTSMAPAYLTGTSGCDALSFTPETLSTGPSIDVRPASGRPDAPSPYNVNIQVPQNEALEGLATPDLRDVTMAFPAGVSISPSGANGLKACSEAQFGLHSGVAGACPSASSVGEMEVITPLLEKPLQGSVFVAQPKCGGGDQPACTEASAMNGELYGLYLEVKGSGVIVKLAGKVSANQATGQLTTTFTNNPQLPFSELHLRLTGGSQPLLANPQTCGTFTTSSDLVPWGAPATPDTNPPSSFGLGGCPSMAPFAPSFSAGTLIPNAASSSPFTLTFSRNDGEQNLAGISTTLPPGLLGLISQVPLCQEPQAARGECAEASRIGTTSVSVGAGSNPFVVNGGRVYLTGPYNGAPFGLSVVVPAKAGPFNLGNEIIRAAINVDPTTAAVTVTSGPLPQIKDGVPFRLKTVNVLVDRPGFMLNPSNCEQHAITGTIASTEGAKASVSSPFAVTGCKAGLQFKPKLTASTTGKTSKKNGTSLDVKVTYPGSGEANIRAVKVELPKAMPSRLATLNRACTAAVFAANPSNCPAESIVGIARAKSPVLPVTLTGPAYLVSHGGAAFPDLVIVLQGDGVRVDLTGNTDIKKGITSSTFASVPDVPINSFELYLPQGKFSVLAANGNLCKQRLKMPTKITGQDGAVITETTAIKVNGCPKATKAKAKAGKAGKGRKASSHPRATGRTR